MINIPNTTIEELKNDSGETVLYKLTPNEGYLLHNSVNDYTEPDEQTGEEIFHLGFSAAPSTVPASYDFENITELDGYTAYGSKKIFAVPVENAET